MDPYFYIWNSLFLAGPGMGQGGITLTLWDPEVQLHVQCVVDDTTLCSATLKGMQDSVQRSLRIFKAMNAACNPTKFGLIHYENSGGRIRPNTSVIEVEGARVKAAKRTQYIKFLGGNAKVLSSAPEDMKKIRVHARMITVQLCWHVQSLAIIMAILYGYILARWLYKRSVGWLAGVEHRQHQGETKELLGIMCNAARRALYLPLKTPKQFFIHQKGMAMTTPLQKFWEINKTDMHEAANARH